LRPWATHPNRKPKQRFTYLRRLGTIPYNLVHCGTLWYNLRRSRHQSGTIWYNLVQSESFQIPIRCNLVQLGAIWYILVQSDTIWHILVQSGTFWTIRRRQTHAKDSGDTAAARRRHEGNTESHTETQKCYFSLNIAHHHTRHLLSQWKYIYIHRRMQAVQ